MKVRKIIMLIICVGITMFISYHRENEIFSHIVIPSILSYGIMSFLIVIEKFMD